MIAWLRAQPVAAGVIGASIIAFSGILVRQADATPETAAVFRCFYALPVLGVLAWLEDRGREVPRSRRERLLGVAAGSFFAADLIFWHHSIDNVGAGLATVLGNLQVVLVAFLAWALLGERPGTRMLVTVPLALLGAVLISGVLEDGAFGADPVLGTVFGGLTSVAYAGFILLLRRANSDVLRPAGPLLDATAAACVVALVAGASYGAVDVVPSWPSAGWLVLLSLSSQVVGWLLISTSLPRLPAAITSLLLLIQPVSAVALSAVLLGEDPTLVQILGVVLILAVVVFGASRRETPAPAG